MWALKSLIMMLLSRMLKNKVKVWCEIGGQLEIGGCKCYEC